MNEPHLSSEQIHSVGHTLVRVQQYLLADGYTFQDGDPSPGRWPFVPVVLAAKQSVIFVAPWSPETASAAMRSVGNLGPQAKQAGWIFVGTEPIHSPNVQQFCHQYPLAVLYLDAMSGQFFAPSRPKVPDPMHPPVAPRYVSPAVPPNVAQIDPRERLVADLEKIEQVKDFYRRTDDINPDKRPWVCHTIIAACVVNFLLMVLFNGWGQLMLPSQDALLAWGANYGPAVRAGQWWRIVTCSFVHVGLIHIGFNMLAMHVIGGLLERFQGRWRTAAIYGFSVVAASVASLWNHPLIVSAGASGGVFGLMGAVGALLVRYRGDFPPHLRVAIRKWIVTILIYNAVFMFVLQNLVDNAAHIGGLVAGFALGLAILRSPVRKTGRPPLWGMVTAGILTAVLLGSTVWVIAQIPSDVPPEAPLTVLRNRLDYQEGLLDQYQNRAERTRKLLPDGASAATRSDTSPTTTPPDAASGPASLTAKERVDHLATVAGLLANWPDAPDDAFEQVAEADTAGRRYLQAVRDWLAHASYAGPDTRPVTTTAASTGPASAPAATQPATTPTTASLTPAQRWREVMLAQEDFFRRKLPAGRRRIANERGELP